MPMSPSTDRQLGERLLANPKKVHDYINEWLKESISEEIMENTTNVFLKVVKGKHLWKAEIIGVKKYSETRSPDTK